MRYKVQRCVKLKSGKGLGRQWIDETVKPLRRTTAERIQQRIMTDYPDNQVRVAPIPEYRFCMA